MKKNLLALACTGAGIAALIGVKAQSAGAPRSALADTTAVAHRHGRHRTAPTPATSVPTPQPTGGSRSGGAADGRYTGSAIATPYGTVQVSAVLRAGKLADVTVLQQTSGGRSAQIDSYALPVLKAEALRAGDARIDVVSGATYTSDGYAQSLQAALDAAGR